MSKRDDDAPETDDLAGPYMKQTISLSPTHRWKASPGYNILVIEAGAVRFEYPTSWKVIPKAGRLQIHDVPPPADEGRFQITVFRLPPLKGKSWEDLPLDQLLKDAATGPARTKQGKARQREMKMVHDVTLVQRPDLAYAWIEQSAPDPENGRTILTRQLMARARGVQPLITFDYYASRADDYRPIWQHVANTLRLGAPVNLLGDSQN